MNKKWLPVMLGLALVLFAGIWKFGISPTWEKRYPEDWTWELETIGGSWLPETEDATPPDRDLREDDLSISSREIDVEYKGDTAEINDHYTAYDATTNVVTWDYTFKAEIDPQTGVYSDADDEYYFFPRFVDKDTTYNLRNSSYPTLPFEFEAEEEIEGLTTYRFGYHGSYPNAPAYGLELPEGQDVRCIMLDSQFWVEPVTGEIVKYYEACAGDEIFETATNTHIRWLGRWWAEPKPENTAERVAEIRDQRNSLLWTSRYLPLGLLLVGLASIVAGVWFMRKPTPTTNA